MIIAKGGTSWGEGGRVSAKDIKPRKLEQSERVKTRVFGKKENAVFLTIFYSFIH